MMVFVMSVDDGADDDDGADVRDNIDDVGGDCGEK